MPRFILEQLALHPQDPEAAISFLSEIGMADWARDHVKARGTVKGWDCRNEADLAFSYNSGAGAEKPLELEVLHYTDGANWMHGQNRASHIAMHVDAGELDEWRAFMLRKGIGVVQEVNTYSHTNPVIAGKREYNYVIFDTHALLSVDMKFILRRDVAQYSDIVSDGGMDPRGAHG